MCHRVLFTIIKYIVQCDQLTLKIIPPYDLNYWFYWTLWCCDDRQNFPWKRHSILWFPPLIVWFLGQGWLVSPIQNLPQARSPFPISGNFSSFFLGFSAAFSRFFFRFSRLFGQISQLYWPEPLWMIPDNPRDNSWSFQAFSWSSREIGW